MLWFNLALCEAMMHPDKKMLLNILKICWYQIDHYNWKGANVFSPLYEYLGLILSSTETSTKVPDSRMIVWMASHLIQSISVHKWHFHACLRNWCFMGAMSCLFTFYMDSKDPGAFRSTCLLSQNRKWQEEREGCMCVCRCWWVLLWMVIRQRWKSGDKSRCPQLIIPSLLLALEF
jgi:hypothetical protein